MPLRMGIGEDITPAQARIGAIAQYVVGRRRAGASDAAILADLRRPSGLPRLHPCADADGRNICLPGEIEQGLALGGKIAPPVRLGGALLILMLAAGAWLIWRRR